MGGRGVEIRLQGEKEQHSKTEHKFSKIESKQTKTAKVRYTEGSVKVSKH